MIQKLNNGSILLKMNKMLSLFNICISVIALVFFFVIVITVNLCISCCIILDLAIATRVACSMLPMFSRWRFIIAAATMLRLSVTLVSLCFCVCMLAFLYSTVFSFAYCLLSYAYYLLDLLFVSRQLFLMNQILTNLSGNQASPKRLKRIKRRWM